MERVIPVAEVIGYTTWKITVGMRTGYPGGQTSPLLGYTTLVWLAPERLVPFQQEGKVIRSSMPLVPAQLTGAVDTGCGVTVCSAQRQSMTLVDWGAVAPSSPAIISSPAGGALTGGLLACRPDQ